MKFAAAQLITEQQEQELVKLRLQQKLELHGISHTFSDASASSLKSLDDQDGRGRSTKTPPSSRSQEYGSSANTEQHRDSSKFIQDSDMSSRCEVRE